MTCARQHVLKCAALAALASILIAAPAYARDAAFLDPGTASGPSNNNEAIKVEPKSEMDIGDSALNIARRTTMFFTNQSSAAVTIEKISINSDSNVVAELSNDDCTKQGTLAPGSRCSVEVSITPNNPGTWSVEVLMTHNGAGRITRAKITGKTTGTGNGEKKESGLFLSNKDVKPIDFGEVALGEGKTVRSALMVNDSPEAITLYSIDVIEAENGLERLDQGCAVDMELKPGESCPVTMVWTPSIEGHISTDLIIRHSGRLGFAVIPIRGITKNATSATATESNKKDTKSTDIAPPPKPDLDKIAVKLPAISDSALQAPGASVAYPSGLHLIGTVGMRGLFFKPDGTTEVAQAGDEVEFDEKKAKILSVGAKSAEVMIDGKKKILQMETIHALTERAKAAHDTSTSTAPAIFTPSGAPGTAQIPTTSSTGLGLSASGSSPYGGVR